MGSKSAKAAEAASSEFKAQYSSDSHEAPVEVILTFSVTTLEITANGKVLTTLTTKNNLTISAASTQTTIVLEALDERLDARPIKLAFDSTEECQAFSSALRIARRPTVRERPECHIGGEPFSFLRKAHHCRRCGEAVCRTCSSARARVPELGYSKAVRVCDECKLHLLVNSVDKNDSMVNSTCAFCRGSR